MLGVVNDRNLRVSLHAILTMLGGYKAKTIQHKSSSFSLLSIDLINVISGFLYGNFSAHRIFLKKKHFFETYINNHQCREITLIPQKQIEEISTELDISQFESVDEIVAKEISAIDSDSFNKKMLLDIYNEL